MKYKFISHTKGECFKALGDFESPDVCVDCAALQQVVQYRFDTNHIERIRDFMRWLAERDVHDTGKFKVSAVLHFVKNLGFEAIQTRYWNGSWQVCLCRKNVRFIGSSPDFVKAYDEAIGGYINLICGWEPKEKIQKPSVYS